jgi:hypothetical protein
VSFCITHCVSDFCIFSIIPSQPFNPTSDTMAFMQKNVGGGADDYHQTANAVGCIITGKTDRMAGAKIQAILFGCGGMQGWYIMDDAVRISVFL